MLKNYFIIAYRNLLKHRAITLINVVGLSVSIAVCTLIALYIWHELTYDRFHEKSDRIYRVLMTPKKKKDIYEKTPFMLAQWMKSSLPEIAQTMRVYQRDGVIKFEDKLFQEDITYVDSNFFDVFTFSLASGGEKEALSIPKKVVLNRAIATKLFGQSDALGKAVSIRIEGEFYDFVVSGIADDIPGNSSISFSILLSLETWGRIDQDYHRQTWNSLAPSTFIMLEEYTNETRLQEKLITLLQNDTEDPKWFNLHIQPITDIHLNQRVSGGLNSTSSIIYIYILSSIGFFILLIAAINFTSLAIGSSTSRAGEVGVRKTFGATRIQLSWQFLGESLLMSLFSFITGGLLAYLLLSPFSQWVGQTLSFDDIWLHFLAIALGITLLTGLAAGSYPAFYLSKFRPALVLKNHLQVKEKNWLIRSLTVVQFTIAVLLSIFTITMNQQMQLLMTKNLGFDQEQVIEIDVPFREGQQLMELYQTELSSESVILGVSAAWQKFGGGGVSFQTLGITSTDDSIGGFSMGVNGKFLETLKIPLKMGRTFSPYAEGEENSNEILVNEALVKEFGWDDPLGRKLSRTYHFTDATIVGVVKDFHFQSLHESIEPLVIYPTNSLTNLYVRITANNIPDKLALLEEKWQKIAPDLPFTYQFLDDTIEQQYQWEKRWADIVQYASVLAIVVAGLGLFGLSMLAAAQRVKEIGIRKVLGASAGSIIALLSRDYVKLILIAILIVIPVANYLIIEWLTHFAYRIEVAWWLFLMPALVVLCIALLSVSSQTWKAARHNPVDSLRYE